MRLTAFIFTVFISSVCLAETQATQEYVVRHTTKKDFRITTVGGVQTHKLKYFNGVVARLTSAQAFKLKSQGFQVERTVPMKVLGAPSKAKTQQQEDIPWGIKSVQAPEAHKLENGQGKGVTVCVIDTGIDSSHPALKDSVVGGEAIVKYDRPDKPLWFDDHGHGTHVSGTIAAHADGLLGVAPKASLYAIKVLDAAGSGTDVSVAEGIKACIGHGQVINMSLGGGEPTKILQDALDEAVKAGIILACAAGNDAGPVGFPASAKGCTAVSAIDSSEKLAYFSSRGPQVAFAAPGVSIKSSIPGGKFAYFDGTSMAAPHVAGTMAVLLSRGKKELKAKDLKLAPTEQGAGEVNALMSAE